MALSIGIVGLPNVGKSTLFRALTKKEVAVENYPFCTIDPSVGIVPVPDQRLESLATLSRSEKTIPAVVEFVDIAGLVKGAAAGEGLGNQFLSHIREVDAILHMIRLFPLEQGGGVTHVYDSVDPLRDLHIITMELVLADLQTVTNRLQKITREVKRGEKQAVAEHRLLLEIQEHLEHEQLAAQFPAAGEEYITRLHLLTAKPMLIALNKRSAVRNLDVTDPEQFQRVLDWATDHGARVVVIDAKTEDELRVFSPLEREEIGASTDGGVNQLIQESYKLLNLISFFTTGEKETRGWTIPDGSRAPDAGAAIHTDFKNRFIKADVIHYSDLLEAGSYAAARARGLVRTEGKEYIVHDGDVIEFKI